MFKFAAIAAGGLLFVSTAALSQMQMQAPAMEPSSMQKMMQDMMPSANDSASTKAYKNTHMKMMKGMHVEFSGNPDIDFVRNMVPHHQGAIDMAKVELEHGKDPELRKMAEKIISDQEKEIDMMQEWLKKNPK